MPNLIRIVLGKFTHRLNIIHLIHGSFLGDMRIFTQDEIADHFDRMLDIDVLNPQVARVVNLETLLDLL